MCEEMESQPHHLKQLSAYLYHCSTQYVFSSYFGSTLTFHMYLMIDTLTFHICLIILFSCDGYIIKSSKEMCGTLVIVLCSGVYRSTWVDEMSEYMRNGVAPDDYEDEEDSDLEDFVASDDEFLDDEMGAGQSHDYSAEIRKLFRYDPRK